MSEVRNNVRLITYKASAFLTLVDGISVV